MFWVMDLFMVTFIFGIWTFGFFMFDELILKGYFKKKLQNRFKVEE
jgi:hypothetical protein